MRWHPRYPDRHRRTSTTRSTESPTPKAMCALGSPFEMASATSSSRRTAGPRLAGIGTAVSEVERHAGEMAMDTDALAALSDERLNARIEMLWDDCIAGWKVGLLCTFLVSAPTAMLERRYGSAAVTQPQGHATPTGQFPSAPGREGTVQASHRVVRRWPRSSPGKSTPRAGANCSVAIPTTRDRFRHYSMRRGIADRVRPSCPMRFTPMLPGCCCVRSPGSAQTAPQQPMEAQPRDLVARLLTKASWSMIAQRERCRDAVMRLTHQLRMALRERGSRMAARGLLVESDDIFYLTSDEVFSSAP